MASADKSRPRRKTHIGLYTQQRRLRHLQSVCACNIQSGCDVDTSLQFTMHVNETSKAFYCSEKSIDIINPKWRNFDETQYPENINASIPEIVLRIWCDHKSGAHVIIEWTVNFSGLQCVGEQIFKNDKKYKYNTIFFRMFECYYTAPDCLQFIGSEKLENYLRVDSQLLRNSYNTSSLLRIHTVQRAIKQTQATIFKIRGLINERLRDAQRNEEKLSQKENLQLMITSLKNELHTQRIKLKAQEEQKSRIIGILHDQNFELMKQREVLKLEKKDLEERKKVFNQKRELLLKTNAELALRRKQLISELRFIYPIQEKAVKNKISSPMLTCLSNDVQVANKGYTIRDVHLPNSEDFVGHDDTKIAVALGFVTHLVSMIANFLDLPLRYPVRHLSSRSKIIDHIVENLPDKEREFPLYGKGKDKLLFNYAVFLLNKNIAQLRYANALITKDLRTTLPNLQGLIDMQIGISLERQSSSTYSVSDAPSLISSSSNLDPRTTTHYISAANATSGRDYLNPDSPNSLSGSNRVSPHLRAGGFSTLPNGTVLSCSLDKGLDELVTSSTPCNPLRHNRSPSLRRTAAFHSGSEPNLTRHQTLQLVEIQTDGSPSSGELRTFPVGMELWGNGSSRGNSDEDVNNLHDGFNL